MSYSGPAFGTQGHLLTNAYGGADYYECTSVTSTHRIYRKRNSTGFTTTDHNIKYAISSDAWQDGSSVSWPMFFGPTNSHGNTSITPTGSATVLHLFHNYNNNNYLFSVNTNLGSGGGTLATITWTPSFAKQSALSMIITATITGTPSSSFPLTAQKDFKLYKLTNGVQTQVSTTVQFLNNTSTMTQFRTFTYAVGSTYYYRHADNGQLMGPMYPPPDIPPSTRKKVHSNFW